MLKLHCESNLKTLARIDDNQIDLTVTSPPYDDLRHYNDARWDLDLLVPELYRATAEGGVVIWVVGDKTVNGDESGSSFEQALFFKKCGFRLHDTMIFAKANPMPSDCGRRYRQIFEYMFCFSKGLPKTFNPLTTATKSAGSKISAFRSTRDGRANTPDEDVGRTLKASRKRGNIFVYLVGSASSRDKIASKHPAIFPEQLAEDQIRSWSNIGDLVFDPFLGSGTTAKASRALKRNFIGSEISREYFDIALTRLKRK